MNAVICVAWVLGVAWYWEVFLFELIDKARKIAQEPTLKPESAEVAVDGIGRTASEKAIAPSGSLSSVSSGSC